MKKLFQAGCIAATMFLFAACRDNQTQQPHDQMHDGDQKAAVYQCPMKDEGDKTYDKPGTCPKCGMDLKKVE